jgi:ribosomal protein S27AE
MSVQTCAHGHAVETTHRFCPTCGDTLPSPVAESAAAPQPGSASAGRGVNWSLWGQRLGRLFSFRVQMACIFAAAIVGFLLSLLWGPLVWAIWPVYALLVLASVFNDDNVLYCPFCKKRVKMGAQACHHCGRSVLSAP